MIHHYFFDFLSQLKSSYLQHKRFLSFLLRCFPFSANILALAWLSSWMIDLRYLYLMMTIDMNICIRTIVKINVNTTQYILYINIFIRSDESLNALLSPSKINIILLNAVDISLKLTQNPKQSLIIDIIKMSYSIIFESNMIKNTR